MKLTLVSIVFLFVIISNSFSQEIKEINLAKRQGYCENNQERLEYRMDWVTTATDTLVYNHKDNNQLGYEVHEIGSDSLAVKRPKCYHDTIISYDNSLYPPRPFGSRFKGHKKKDGKHYDTRLIIDEYEYKSFAYKDITSIQYPPKGSIPQTGCIMCVLFPPLYPFLIHDIRVRSIPQTYLMDRWQIYLVVENK